MDEYWMVDKQNRPKIYVKPEILYELELETRAGSPIGPLDPLDPFNLVDWESR